MNGYARSLFERRGSGVGVIGRGCGTVATMGTQIAIAQTYISTHGISEFHNAKECKPLGE